ncbi:Nuclear speckle splicing regulatory protein 1-like protein [Smittium mucronatum]|uniref:Nuclear speckle splicing regulatory protein 1-like protein n=1 Tax=Smittium mucronatum TaxID=133383 RepID=A0A1R0GXY6_9FUNG|nr:Nuclear speckle splicing regulatory protein 1-like protein [Smittium mucronatum]
MVSFYDNLLNESESNKLAAINVKVDGGHNSPETDSQEEDNTADLIKAAEKRGETVEVNLDNQIIDKRQLLAPGLNVQKRPAKKPAFSSPPSHQHNTHPQLRTHYNSNSNHYRNPNRAGSQPGSSGFVDDERPKSDQNLLVRKNTADSIQAARQRYLERKNKVSS